jgi:hypothetical protein
MLPNLKIRSLLQLQELLESKEDNGFIEKIKNNPAEAIRDITEPPAEDEFKQYKIGSVQELRDALDKEPRLIDMLKYDPVRFIQKMAKESPPPQYNIYRILVGSLCAVLILIIIGVITAWFTKNSREAPTLITAVACTTLGILAGMFVNIPKHNSSQPSAGNDKNSH